MKTKEEVLTELQDVVKTLFSDNINHDFIKAKWRLKSKQVDEDVKALNSCDLLWLSEEYSKWHEIEVKPNIDTDLINHIEGEDFTWV
jgi:hypothetical protein